MSESTKATIEILEHYHHNGGFYEIINTVEQELEEQDKEIERLNNIIKEAREKIEGVRIYGLRSGKTLIATLLNDILEILDKEVN